MCASVHADFCRPKGLESARPGPAPTQYGTIEVAINYQYGKTQYYSYAIHLGSADIAHIGIVALGNDAAVLALSHWHLYLS